MPVGLSKLPLEESEERGQIANCFTYALSLITMSFDKTLLENVVSEAVTITMKHMHSCTASC